MIQSFAPAWLDKLRQTDVAIRDSGTMGASLLFRIVSDLAWGFLWENRQNKAFNTPPPPSMDRSIQWLNDLANGVRIFPLQENMEAGHMEHDITTPIEIEQRNGVVQQARRYFGRRAYSETFWG